MSPSHVIVVFAFVLSEMDWKLKRFFSSPTLKAKLHLMEYKLLLRNKGEQQSLICAFNILVIYIPALYPFFRWFVHPQKLHLSLWGCCVT